MSDFDRIPALLAAIADECPMAPDRLVRAELSFGSNRRPVVIVYCADADEFQEQYSPVLDVSHIEGTDGRSRWASIDVMSGPDEDPIALLERALDFVRTETPVPL